MTCRSIPKLGVKDCSRKISLMGKLEKAEVPIAYVNCALPKLRCRTGVKTGFKIKIKNCCPNTFGIKGNNPLKFLGLE